METKRKLKLLGYFSKYLELGRGEPVARLVFSGNFSVLRIPSARRYGKVMSDSNHVHLYAIRHNLIAYLGSITEILK